MPEEGTRKEKIAADDQALADVFEKGIAEHPEDWHMLQRLWLEDLDPELAPPSAAAEAAADRPAGERDREDRHRLPVHLGCARRRPGAHPRPRRGAHRRSATTSR